MFILEFKFKIIIYLRFQYVQKLSVYIVLFLQQIDVSYRHIAVVTICKDRMCQYSGDIRQCIFSATLCNFKMVFSAFLSLHSGLTKRQCSLGYKVKFFLFFVSNLCTFIMFRTFVLLKSLYKILIISKTESESLLSVRLVRFFFLKNTNA